jgi:hypothetical protein
MTTHRESAQKASGNAAQISLAPVRGILQRNGSGSFSQTRSWPKSFVEKLKVVRVHESPDVLQ